MKVSLGWLRSLLPGLPTDPHVVAKALTGAGLEVEGLETYGAASRDVVVAKVTKVEPHPKKDGLRLVTVDKGGAEQTVVCGAPNVPAPGGLVVLAGLGVHLPALGVTLGKRAIAGVDSEGMLTSERELGLGDASEGILVLDHATLGLAATDELPAAGVKLADAVPEAFDHVLEIGLTPNRPDGLGHVGVARELAALLRLPLTPRDPAAALPPPGPLADGERIEVRVQDAERCPHYGGVHAAGVTVRPSPLRVRLRLQALGVRAVSNVVDVTNLVMLEYGHPMHAFDAAKVAGRAVVVRRAKPEEALVTLDGVTRTLVVDDLVIADADRPTALAGVMGGRDSEISETTSRVFFECAVFDPRTVRRSARRHGMHTESSHRFERGVDPADVTDVLARALELLRELAGASQAGPLLHVVGGEGVATPPPPPRTTIQLRRARLADVLGFEVPWFDAVGILERLGCETVARSEDAVTVLAPTHRPDLGREIDLVEEVLRVVGLDAVPAELPPVRASRAVGGRDELLRRVRRAAVSLGLSEAVTFGFTSRALLGALRAEAPAVVLKNPLGEHHGVMRTSLLPGLVEALVHAWNHGERDVRLFTVGATFHAPTAGVTGEDAELPEERQRFAALLAGDRAGWLAPPSPLDPWDALGAASGLVDRLVGAPPTLEAFAREACPAHLHPRAAARVALPAAGAGEAVPLGTVGALHPDVLGDLGLGGPVFVLELELAPLLGREARPAFRAIPRFPASRRDLALVVADATRAGDVLAAIREAAGPLAESVETFDRFVGGSVPAGSVSLAFRVTYRSLERTLTDAEVDQAHARVVEATRSRLGASLRA